MKNSYKNGYPTKISIHAMKLPPSNLVAYFLISIYNVKPFLAVVKHPLNIYFSTSMKGLTLWNEFSVCIRMNKWHLTPVFYILEYVNALTVCRIGVFRWEYFYMYEQLYSEKSAIEWMKVKILYIKGYFS